MQSAITRCLLLFFFCSTHLFNNVLSYEFLQTAYDQFDPAVSHVQILTDYSLKADSGYEKLYGIGYSSLADTYVKKLAACTSWCIAWNTKTRSDVNSRECQIAMYVVVNGQPNCHIFRQTIINGAQSFNELNLKFEKYTGRTVMLLRSDITPYVRRGFQMPQDLIGYDTFVANGDFTHNKWAVCNLDSSYIVQKRTLFSLSECMLACKTNRDCAAIYVDPSSSTCTLLKHCELGQVNNGYTQVYRKNKFYGSDITLYHGKYCSNVLTLQDFSTPSLDECIEACYANYDCKIFEFILGKRCKLKSGCGVITSGPNTLMGAPLFSSRTRQPTQYPTKFPTKSPTNTKEPTAYPTKEPTPEPTSAPTRAPTAQRPATKLDSVVESSTGSIVFQRSTVVMFDGFDTDQPIRELTRATAAQDSSQQIWFYRRRGQESFLSAVSTPHNKIDWDVNEDAYKYAENANNSFGETLHAAQNLLFVAPSGASIHRIKAYNLTSSWQSPQYSSAHSFVYPGLSGSTMDMHRVAAALSGQRVFYVGYATPDQETGQVQASIYVTDGSGELSGLQEIIKPPYHSGNSVISQTYFGRGLFVSQDGNRLAICDDHEDVMSVFLYIYDSQLKTYQQPYPKISIPTQNEINHQAQMDCHVEWKNDILVVGSARAMTSSILSYSSRYTKFYNRLTISHDKYLDTMLPYAGAISTDGQDIVAVGLPEKSRVDLYRTSDAAITWNLWISLTGSEQDNGFGVGVNMDNTTSLAVTSFDLTNYIYLFDRISTMAPTKKPTQQPTTPSPFTQTVPTATPTVAPTKIPPAPTISPVSSSTPATSPQISPHVLTVSTQLISSRTDKSVSGFVGQYIELQQDGYLSSTPNLRIKLSPDGSRAFVLRQRSSYSDVMTITSLAYDTSTSSWAPGRELLYPGKATLGRSRFGRSFALSNSTLLATATGAEDTYYSIDYEFKQTAATTHSPLLSTTSLYHDVAGDADMLFLSGAGTIQIFHNPSSDKLDWVGTLSAPLFEEKTSLYGRGLHASQSGSRLAVCDETLEVRRVFLYSSQDPSSGAWQKSYTISLPSSTFVSSPYANDTDCKVEWKGDILLVGSSRERYVAIYQYAALRDTFSLTKLFHQPEMSDFGQALATNGGNRIAIGYPSENYLKVYTNSATSPSTWEEISGIYGTSGGFAHSISMSDQADLLITTRDAPYRLAFFTNQQVQQSQTQHPLEVASVQEELTATPSSGGSVLTSTVSLSFLIMLATTCFIS